MSLILHLSDLHLGSPHPAQLDYDDKVAAVGDDGPTEQDHLAHTLEALGKTLAGEGRSLDALVVSGDITKGNEPDGYADFDPLLAKLGEALPGPDRIVVVPGNHDVDATLGPGDPAKLERFCGAVRASYRTPLIKGVDYNGANHGADPILLLDDAVIVAINSADYCWTMERLTEKTTDWEAVMGTLADNTDEEVAKRAQRDLMRLRNHDMARIDKNQLDALKGLLDAAGVDPDPDEDPRLRIAVLHHPIGVVTDREEVKPFEAITNLAALRSFLYHRGFHLVLHGHKHRSFAGWDWLAPAKGDLETPPRRALVLAAAGEFRIGNPAAWLIDVCPDGAMPVAAAPRLRLNEIDGVETAQALELDGGQPVRSLAQPFLDPRDANTPWVVKARTADAVYQQLHDLPADDQVPRAVISVVEDPESTATLPTNYAKTDVALDLKDLVDWWQLPRPEAVDSYAGSAFNHGERLYNSGDAIEKAVRALPSSKALAVLVRPEELGVEDKEWPAFTAVQIQARRRPDGGHYLDVVGIYRKQDLALWWPVNMAELAAIQEKAVRFAKDISSASLKPPIDAGKLIAIATLGVHDNVLPQMAGTALDRAVDLRPWWIYKLAYLAAHPGPKSLEEWAKALDDIGDREGKGLLVPSIGVQSLQTALGLFIGKEGIPERFGALADAVKALANTAKSYEDTLKPVGKASAGSLDGASGELKKAAGRVRAALEAVIGDAGAESEGEA